MKPLNQRVCILTNIDAGETLIDPYEILRAARKTFSLTPPREAA